jgi:transposase
MDIKAILKRCHPIKGFIYEKSWFGPGQSIGVKVRPRHGTLAVCLGCGLRGKTYDTARNPRSFAFIPFWGFAVVLLYCMRRVDCRRCGVTTEMVPWADGKQQSCYAYRQFLAFWAKRLSWTEVGRAFNASWGVVFRSVKWVVDWGLAHRDLNGIGAIGIDEIAVWKGHKYLTIVYQIDAGVRRMLWVGRDRTEQTLTDFFTMFGPVHAANLRYVASDMWKPYLRVISRFASTAVHVLDRFHIVAKLNKAIDEVRAGEARKLAAQGYTILKHSRWCFLKKPKNLTPSQKLKLKDVLRFNLVTVRAYNLAQSFGALWAFRSPTWAGWFIDGWTANVMRSRIPQLKKFALTLRNHKPLILNWFRAKGLVSSAVVEALNSNAKLAIRKARGFRTFEALETSLFHRLGKLPEPMFFTHRFW